MSAARTAVAACGLLAALAACGGGGGATTPAEPAAPAPTPSAIAGVAGAAMFDATRLHEVRLVMDPADWASLRAHYLTDQYYAARVLVDGASLDQAGVRSRGSGSRNAAKPALKVDFDRYVPGQELQGYKNVILDNQITDPSFLRERLSYAVFEAMGIAAPRNAFARLFVNDAYWGLYQITEPVSKPFLHSRLGEEGGNLFEYNWLFAWDFSPLGRRASDYVPAVFQPQTNEDHLDASALVDFVAAASEGDDASFARTMTPWLDLDRFVTQLAVENATAESDGLLGHQGMNNFYLYQYEGQRRFVFVPWDKDTAFATDRVPVYDRVETNVLARRLLLDAALRQRYVAELRRAVTSYVNDAWLGPRLEQAYAQVRDAALADPHKVWTNEQFELAVPGLRGLIAARQADVLAQTGGS
jgi:spore coat protein CotH